MSGDEAAIRVGPYDVLREIGRGGMGVVYLARDAKLDRDVAIKALPESLDDDPDRLSRFEREARTLAALNHPNIASIYGLEEDGGKRYIILEFVPGDTLDAVLNEGPIPVCEALPIAAQIAEAIECAHEKGIVHRDLKPANIKITGDDVVKVLDFGIAKALSNHTTSAPDLASSPTYIETHTPTMPGVVMGTAGYLSPEQARGRPVDKRSDIFSFGCVLFEMLTGACVFTGETVADSLGATLHKEPDWNSLPADTPPTIALLLRRCLAKDRKRRLHDIADARVEIQEAISDPTNSSLELAASAVAASGARRARSNPLQVVAALLVGVVITALAAWFLRPEVAPLALEKFDLLTNLDEDDISGTQISPDGQRVAYLSDGVIHVRDLASFEPRALTNTEDVEGHFWSPDGEWIGYISGKSIYKVALMGGGAVKLAELESSPNKTGGWTLDGRIILSVDDDLVSVPARGGRATVINEERHEDLVDFHDTGVIVGSNVMLYLEHRMPMNMLIVADDGERRITVAESDQIMTGTPVYSPTGHVLFTRGFAADIWAVGFDLETMAVTGEQFLILPDAAAPSVALDGTMVVRRGGSNQGGLLARIDSSGTISTTDVQVASFGANPLLSPDGSRIAFSRGNDAKRDVWIHEIARGTTSRTTFLEGFVIPVAWSPDGSELAVAHWSLTETANLSTQFYASDGSGASRDAIELGAASFDATWERMIGLERDRVDGSKVFEVRLDDPSNRIPIDIEDTLILSPDWSLAAFTDSGSGQSEVFCTTYPEGAGRWQISTEGGLGPVWSADGETLYFRSGNTLNAVDVTREPTVRFSMPRRVLDGEALGLDLTSGWSSSRDGEQFIVISQPEDEGPPPVISVIRNWYEEFRQQ